jgi:hypothetical protein
MTTLDELAQIEAEICGDRPPRERTLFDTAMWGVISKREQDNPPESFVADCIASDHSTPEEGVRYANAVTSYLDERGIETAAAVQLALLELHEPYREALDTATDDGR